MVATRTLKWLAAVLLLASFTAARVMAGADALAGSEWRPVEMAGEVMPADTPLFIRFEANAKVTGHGGCNALFGKYAIDKATLSIGPLAATRKACPPAIMKREVGFISALEKTRLFLRDGARLTLKDARGVTVVRLAQTDWD